MHESPDCHTESSSLPNQMSKDQIATQSDICSSNDVHKPGDKELSKGRYNTAATSMGARSKQLPQPPVHRNEDRKHETERIKIHTDNDRAEPMSVKNK